MFVFQGPQVFSQQLRLHDGTDSTKAPCRDDVAVRDGKGRQVVPEMRDERGVEPGVYDPTKHLEPCNR